MLMAADVECYGLYLLLLYPWFNRSKAALRLRWLPHPPALCLYGAWLVCLLLVSRSVVWGALACP